MKIVVASNTEYLVDSVLALINRKYVDHVCEVVYNKTDLVRNLVNKDFKVIIITEDFDPTLDLGKLISSYDNLHNYFFVSTNNTKVTSNSKYAKILYRSVLEEDISEALESADLFKNRINVSTLPQIDNMQVISFWSVNPRNLKTTLAHNLAYQLAKGSPQADVLLVGMNLDNPTLSHLLKTETNEFELLIPTIGEGTADEDLLNSISYTYKELPNLHVLGGLDNKSLFHLITDTFVENLISVLRVKYKYIILDLGSSLYSVPTVVSLKNSDLVINVIDKDITTFIYGWKESKQLLKSFGINLTNMVTILNQFYKNDIYSDQKVLSHIGLYNIGMIPDLSAAVSKSMIKKKLLVESLDENKEMKLFGGLLDIIYKYIVKENPPAKTGLFSRLFGGA